MSAVRFQCTPARQAGRLVAGFLLLGLSLPMALMVMLMIDGSSDMSLRVVFGVSLLLAWINVAWVSRTIGLLSARVAPEVVLTADGLFVRSVRRSYDPVDLFRPWNVWDERTIGWGAFRRCEGTWDDLDGHTDLREAVIHSSDGPPLTLNASVFSPHLPAILTAIEGAVQHARNAGLPADGRPAMPAPKRTVLRVLQMAGCALLIAAGIRFMMTMYPVAVRDPWAWLMYFPITGALVIWPAYVLSGLSVKLPPLAGIGTNPAGVQTSFPFIVSANWVQVWLFWFGTYWVGMKLHGWRHQECARCRQRRLFAQYRFFRVLHFWQVPVLPLGFGRLWTCSACGENPGDKGTSGSGDPAATSAPPPAQCPVCTQAALPPPAGRCLHCGVIRLG